MIPAPFDYEKPDSVEEAVQLLKKYGADAKILAGGAEPAGCTESAHVGTQSID